MSNRVGAVPGIPSNKFLIENAGLESYKIPESGAGSTALIQPYEVKNGLLF
jgi:hypothetical protein